MIKKEQLKPGMIIRFKQHTDKKGAVNKIWLLKKLEFIGFANWFGKPCITYKCKEHVANFYTTDNKIHSDILLTYLQYMEIVGERKSHLPKWW